ncbi:uncharacterized protein [Pseudochaenichthys georgianus]|uniref:uncharacterized protein n=1 Tax=Pseudochaenichthys georgianus TaxID=52239 RepID=UPI0039C1F8AE
MQRETVCLTESAGKGDLGNMSKVQMLLSLKKQRLTAANEEIFALFEQTITELEEELFLSKEENKRLQKLLDAVSQPQLRIHRADDAIVTSEEEQSRTPGGGSVPSSTSERTSTRPQTPAEEESTPTPSAITTPQRVVLGKRKRGGDEHLAQQARHHEQSLAQVDRHWQLTMEAVARAREEEMALRREENAQTHAFNLAFLRTLGQVLGGSRRGPSPQEDEPPL